MEINKYTDIEGVVTLEAIPEGRMVIIAPNTADTIDFGSRADLMGARLPVNSTEAGVAKFVLAFSLDNRPLPIYETVPSTTFNTRMGYGQSPNVPFSATVHLSHPGNTEGQTIPSGALALAFDRGVFTVPSGAYVYSASLTAVGANLVVANVADDTTDAGKLKYSASAGVAVVQGYDSETGALTFRTL